MTNRQPLTETQQAVLSFYRDYVAEHRIAPAYRDVMEHFGWRSLNSVTNHVQSLLAKGYLKRAGDKRAANRAIIPVDEVMSSCPTCGRDFVIADKMKIKC